MEWTGDGQATRQITTRLTGQTPVFVLAYCIEDGPSHPSGNQNHQTRKTPLFDVANPLRSSPIGGAGGGSWTDQGIRSLDVSGFTVGSVFNWSGSKFVALVFSTGEDLAPPTDYTIVGGGGQLRFAGASAVTLARGNDCFVWYHTAQKLAEPAPAQDTDLSVNLSPDQSYEEV